MIKACIFDLDGTILNTVISLCHPANVTLLRYGLEPITEEDTKRFVGNGYRTLVKRFMNYRGIEDEDTIEEARNFFSGEFEKDPAFKVSAYDGMPDALDFLKRKGMKLGVLSNKSDDRAKLVVESIYGSNMFDVIRGAVSGVPLKPDPQSLIAMIKDMNISPEECLYFGDTDIDIETGKKAGCVTVGCSWGYRPRKQLEDSDCDFLIDSPVEIDDLICGINYSYTIDGAIIDSEDDLYELLYAQMIVDPEFEPGHNLDALADVVRGGYGMHQNSDECSFVWISFARSVSVLEQDFIMNVLKVITAEGSSVTLV